MLHSCIRYGWVKELFYLWCITLYTPHTLQDSVRRPTVSYVFGVRETMSQNKERDFYELYGNQDINTFLENVANIVEEITTKYKTLNKRLEHLRCALPISDVDTFARAYKLVKVEQDDQE